MLLLDRLWEIGDIVALAEAADTPAKKRGSFKQQTLTARCRRGSAAYDRLA
jgi:hypothetical protein